MDAKQLAAIELAMAEEHKRDKEALERLKRFIRNGDNGQPIERVRLNIPAAPNSDTGSEGTIRKKIEEVFEADPERKWTIPQMLEHLRSINFPLKAQKPEATLYGVFQILRSRTKIRLVRRGSGRNPSTFRLATGERENGPAEENNNSTLSPSSEKLIAFLRSHGPTRRSEIISNSGIPAGTIANQLTKRKLFRQTSDGKWEAIPQN